LDLLEVEAVLEVLEGTLEEFFGGITGHLGDMAVRRDEAAVQVVHQDAYRVTPKAIKELGVLEVRGKGGTRFRHRDTSRALKTSSMISPAPRDRNDGQRHET